MLISNCSDDFLSKFRENQKIKTMQIKDWKSKKETIEKEPAIFIFHSGVVTF